MPRSCLPNCLFCGDELVPDKHVARGLKRFCSPSCGNKWRAVHEPKKTHHIAKRAGVIAGKQHRKKTRKVHPPSNKGRIKIQVKGKRMLRSRYILEKKLGRKLRPNEIAHHIDEDIQNDRPSNLEPRTYSEHTSHHRKKRERERG
jgi:hypothetical protein